MIWLISQKHQKNLCLGEGAFAKSLISIWNDLKHFSNIMVQPRRDVIFVGKKSFPKTGYLRPQDRHAHRTQGSTHAMSAEDQLIGLSFCVFFRWNQQTANGWFHPKELVGFWDGFLRCFSSLSENEKGVFSGFPGRLFLYHIPLIMTQGILRNEWWKNHEKEGVNYKWARNIIATYCSRNMFKKCSIASWLVMIVPTHVRKWRIGFRHFIYVAGSTLVLAL